MFEIFKRSNKTKIKSDIVRNTLQKLNSVTEEILSKPVSDNILKELQNYRMGRINKSNLFDYLENEFLRSLQFSFQMALYNSHINNLKHNPSVNKQDLILFNQKLEKLKSLLEIHYNRIREEFHKRVNLIDLDLSEEKRRAEILRNKELEFASKVKKLFQECKNFKFAYSLVITREYTTKELKRITELIQRLEKIKPGIDALANNDIKWDLTSESSGWFYYSKLMKNKYSNCKSRFASKIELKKAIEEGNVEVLKRRLPLWNGNLKLLDTPPKFLAHGVSPIKPDKTGSWEYAINLGDYGLSPQEYVNFTLRLMNEGLKPSLRRHPYSTAEVPAIYFFDANDNEVGLSPYGIIELIFETPQTNLPVFMAPGTGFPRGATEYLIFTKNLKGRFKIRLRPCYRPAVKYNISGYSYHLAIKEELVKRGIPFEEHPLFTKFLNDIISFRKKHSDFFKY